MSDLIQSQSVTIKPRDSRCRYWAKIVRANQPLPMPEGVSGASEIPGPYLKNGDEELFAGDILFQGEANHHRRTDRGWSYIVSFLDADGELVNLHSGYSEQKAQMKAQGMSGDLLKGSGDVAAMVRIGHGVRAGMKID